jgi:2-polyprenyl-6-methoxyphenol hydroxylase-like FAD-dependent oxidoreductase
MSANDKRAPVLVVGGGISGLGAGLALSRMGIPVHIIEQAPEFKEIGAGIQLGPNVFRMFEYLGLTEEMSKWAVFPLGLEMRDAITGEPSPSCRSMTASMRSIARLTRRYTAPTCSTSSMRRARDRA